MRIEEINYSKDISVRSFNVCNGNNLRDLTSILIYYRYNKTFNKLKNIGRKLNEELTALYFKYSEFNKFFIDNLFAQKNKINSIVNENFKKLSIISQNGLNKYLNNDLDICNIYIKIFSNKKFTPLNLNNIGNNSIPEINTFINEIKYLVFHMNKEGILELKDMSLLKLESSLISKISNFTRTQREIVNSFIETNFSNLSNRSSNALTSFLNRNLKIQNISEKILTNDTFNFRDLNNVGIKMEIELNIFIDSIKEFIEKVSEIEDENDLTIIRNRFFIEKTFSISSIPYEILESQSIFKLVDFLICEDAIFEKRENIIFQKTFKIYNNQPELIFDEIAEELDISRERIRQIRNKCLVDLFKNLQFLKRIDDDLYQKYGFDENQMLIFIGQDLNDQINEINNTTFSREFSTIIIYSYFSDKFDLVGNIEDVLQPRYFNSKDRHYWDNFYLVSKKISCLFNFMDFANDINKRSIERLEESYYFNFKSYLLSFSTSTNLEVLSNISKVAEKILNSEFGLYIDTDDNIRFTRNSLKQAYQYAYEALKLLGKPSKVNEITKKVEELHPDYETNDAKVRTSMKRNNGFVPIGRSSIFGLKEWENELENFKGGTIRQIVAEYLTNNSSPKNYSDITSYVLQFRPKTNENSIIHNLKLDESKAFIFFKKSFVGLSNKIYDKTLVSLTNSDAIEKKSWQERYTELTEFLALNNRLPFSSGCPENEIKLYRWYKIQVGKTINGEIEDEKSNLINEVINTFAKGESSRRTSLNIIRSSKNVRINSKYTLDDLFEFIINKKRMPDSRDPAEGSLYQFYYRNKKTLENIDSLSGQELNLMELIEKYGSSKQPKYTIDELMEFIMINKRMPDSKETNERGLYRFAYKQKKLLEEGDLDQFEENKFIEIIKIIQNNMYENKRN